MGRKIIYFIMSRKLVQWVIGKILPKIRLSTGYGRTTYEDYQAIEEYAEVGDLIFSTDRAKLSTFLIPGQWSHVGIISNVYKGVMIIEAVPEGVRKTNLYDFCKTSDQVMLSRLKRRPEQHLEIVTEAVATATSLIGRPYDFGFWQNNRALYCAELIAVAYAVVKFDWSDLLGLGFEYLTPDGVAASPEIETVYERKLLKT